MDPFPNPAEPMSAAEGGGDIAGAARRRAQHAGETIMAVLPRLIPLACRVASFIKMLTIASLVAALVTLAAVLSIDVPRTLTPWVILSVVAAVLVSPAVVLWLFYRALEEVLALPAWLRSSPDLARRHAAELSDLVRAAKGEAVGSMPSDGSSPRARRGKDLWRSGRLLLEAKNDLPGYGSVLRLISPAFLFMVFIAFVAAWAEILFAAVAVLFAVVVRLF